MCTAKWGFFKRFMMFTITLVYSVVCNQSLVFEVPGNSWIFIYSVCWYGVQKSRLILISCLASLQLNCVIGLNITRGAVITGIIW